MRTKFFLTMFGLLATVTAWAGPQIQQWKTPQGAQVLFVEDHNLPMLDVAVNFTAGSAYDTVDKAGLAALTHSLLDHGSEGLAEDEISRRIADLGAQLGGAIDADRSSVTLRTLSVEREPSLALLARILQQPVFPESVLSREKTRIVAALKEAETKPDHIAAKAFSQAVYGAHPYGIRAEVATVSSLGRDEVVAFYRAHYVTNTAVVAIMGDVTRGQAEAIAVQLTGQLPHVDTTLAIPAVSPLTTASEQRIPHPAKQSHILIGAPGMARNDPDYFALYVGNYVLGGGGFVSRLMEQVREQRGLAYDVHSYFMPMQQAGAFQIGLQTKREQAGEALTLVRKVLADFVSHGPTEQELSAAKQNIVGGFPLRVDSNRKILEYLGVIGFYHLPLSYLDDFTGKVQGVTVLKIQEAFRRHITPSRMATVVVGVDAGVGK